MKNLITIFLALAFSSCLYKPEPVTLDKLEGKGYIRSASHEYYSGKYKGQVATLVEYDSVLRILVDKSGRPIQSAGDMALMNYWHEQGFRLVQYDRMQIGDKAKVPAVLLQRRD